MANAYFTVPTAENEPILDYAPGSTERESLKTRLQSMASEQTEIPIIIGGKPIETGNLGDVTMPHDHGHVLARFHKADASHVAQAVEASQKAWRDWSEMPWEHRAAVFLKAAELLSSSWRDTLNAATMLGQSKTAIQAEIDSACEFIDFLRFNVEFMTELYAEQPFSPKANWNQMEYRALEGFIFAITPFNFTAIAGNLPGTPAMLGNTVLWKPAETQMLSAYYTMRLFEEAGLPDGVINFIPGPASEIGTATLNRRELAGIHFTGSTQTFQHLWRHVGENIANYDTYPRIVGETGGKDFIFAHPSADVEALAAAIVRGAFEFQGQKCSAASRVYCPKSIWPEVKERVSALMDDIKMGDVRDFSNFMSAVIDARSYKKIKGYIDFAKDAADATVFHGGDCDDNKGYFIEPTAIETRDPKFKTMQEEIFGPVVTIYPYEDSALDETLELCNSTSPYGLTGAVFAQDRQAIVYMNQKLRHAAGNFYINDKPTGAVVSQQPFGGGRASGTNDKAGSKFNLLRWLNVRSIKENFTPPYNIDYPHMGEP
jgi:1-pyrroline-5-carboxylate dehydrogenase